VMLYNIFRIIAIALLAMSLYCLAYNATVLGCLALISLVVLLLITAE
jgi:hypothetical protein